MTLYQPMKFSLLFLISFFLAIPAHGDNNAGKNKSSICQGCHGNNGISNNPLYPNLAGQRAGYLKAQLKAFRSGQRINSIMQDMTAKLTEQDIKDISIYFSSLSAESSGKKMTVERKGQSKFAMCAGCHGSAAQGRGSIPKLAGQQAEYLKKQLLDFKNGSRKGGPMNAMTSSLSEQDISEIAAYLENL